MAWYLKRMKSVEVGGMIAIHIRHHLARKVGLGAGVREGVLIRRDTAQNELMPGSMDRVNLAQGTTMTDTKRDDGDDCVHIKQLFSFTKWGLLSFVCGSYLDSN